VNRESATEGLKTSDRGINQYTQHQGLELTGIKGNRCLTLIYINLKNIPPYIPPKGKK
jgi:hypothetical protein